MLFEFELCLEELDLEQSHQGFEVGQNKKLDEIVIYYKDYFTLDYFISLFIIFHFSLII